MSQETVNLSISFEFLLQAIAKLDATEKEWLWQFLDTDLHGDDADDVFDPQEEAEIAQAYREYEAGEYLTLEEYVAQRAARNP